MLSVYVFELEFVFTSLGIDIPFTFMILAFIVPICQIDHMTSEGKSEGHWNGDLLSPIKHVTYMTIYQTDISL